MLKPPPQTDVSHCLPIAIPKLSVDVHKEGHILALLLVVLAPGNEQIESPFQSMTNKHPGLEKASNYSLFGSLWARRSRRISKGIKQIRAGDLTYESDQEPQPLSELEEALLIAAVGLTGPSMPDRPFEDEDGDEILGTPNIIMLGRSAGSPDNAQATHFFLINDSGTYFLRRPENAQPVGNLHRDGSVTFDEDKLIQQANDCKVQVLDRRLDLPREMPYYVGSNRFTSNLAGSTILLPIVDISQQYINGLMFLLTQPEGNRPAFTDEMKFNRYAGVKPWVRSGYLNANMKIPLGFLGSLRAGLEAPMLLQNLMLVLQSMGLGGWIHATYSGPILTGHPQIKKQGFANAFNFEYQTPRFRLKNILNWLTYSQGVRPHPVGFKHNGKFLLKSFTPHQKETMSEIIDNVLELKYGPEGVYSDIDYFQSIFKGAFAEKYIEQVPHFTEETIEVAKALCEYIYRTYGRFPAHADAIQVPGIWFQAHHLDFDYYDHLFKNPYTDVHKNHTELWDAADTGDKK